PWTLKQEGERYYGRGSADNKAQHSINMAALETVIAERGRLGFNAKFMLETGEELSSPGLRAFCEQHCGRLKADVLIASDGPRLSAKRPTLYLGSRGAMNLNFTVELREGAHHSGNWGGLLANPGIILAHALASIVTREGKVLVRDLLPERIPENVRAALVDCTPQPEEGEPTIDSGWGEPGLTAAEKLYAWNTFEILAFRTGNPDNPVNAIPGKAVATCQIRFVVGTDPERFIPILRRHLDANGFDRVKIGMARKSFMQATRLDPDHPWVRWAAESIRRTTGVKPAILPNVGGSLPNDCFSEVLGLPTIWVPHSYAGCSQHAPNEHVLTPILREGLQMMTGLFWDLAEDHPSA
ncbi:MAG: M20/M25/M40 family metallo-hydrolase, partial [Betaproteobacteria bacterium]|nr:M20/M25/M40 family metallo-hydrolase [Betaproteobacteria bacterium]